ncbi:migration and invasion-inhibitory protein isoform X1 [Acanthochromis polyacanthus]|uniref:migration and invasion-inhibitory protein isoform X1 n=1 Tax=Acanthochromis polyacanthus TaxID=80966 RepID=UPI002233E5B9|nr:migration and invasion-inhibitory protein isoform X1 [Acanthochromis polyacanthus]
MSLDRLDVLRERNKHLLTQLRQQRDELELQSGRSESRKREREDEGEMVTLTGGDRRPARAALSRPSVRFADICERQTDIRQTFSTPSLTSKPRERSSERTTSSDLFRAASQRHPEVHNKLHVMETEAQNRVTFQSDEHEDIPASDRHSLQPLLGYDWIAGVLDAEDSLVDRSDEFFNDLHVFRSLNREECVHSGPAELSEENPPVSPPLTDKADPEANVDTHQCTFSYRINSRLFPVPLHSQERCPVCKKHKSSHPHTAAEPALVRVSIPRSNLLPPYKYKAHRRCSFDPSDSLGLPSHCLSGWSNTGQSTLLPPSSLDLRSSLNIKNSTGLLNQELEDLSAPKVSGNRNLDQISDVSRLAHHSFQHFSPKRKLRSTSQPGC